ncbi:hypothetical protein OIU76_001525, partial [Salix suchowensis]
MLPQQSPPPLPMLLYLLLSLLLVGALVISRVSSLVGATLATWYSSLLIASLWRWNGKKQITYRHLAESIFGFWGYWSIAFFQQVASLGNNIAIQIAAGSSLKAVYKHYHKE